MNGDLSKHISINPYIKLQVFRNEGFSKFLILLSSSVTGAWAIASKSSLV